MKDKDLLRAMSDIKDEYILEAAPDNLLKASAGVSGQEGKSPVKLPVWRRPVFRTAAVIAAASFVLVIGLGTWRLSDSGKQQNLQPEMAVEDDLEPDQGKEGLIAQPGGESGLSDSYMKAESAADGAFEEETETEAVTEAASERETESRK